MQSWIAYVHCIAHKLEDVEAEATNKDMILVLTQGLPSSYDNFVVSLDATAASNLTLNYVISRLLNEEAHQGIPTVSLSSALVAAHPHCSWQNITC